MNDAGRLYQPWECFAQPISLALALFVGRCQWLGSVDPVQDPQPRGRDDIVQVIERAGDEAAMEHSSA
jgi:hypothetical protein